MRGGGNKRGEGEGREALGWVLTVAVGGKEHGCTFSVSPRKAARQRKFSAAVPLQPSGRCSPSQLVVRRSCLLVELEVPQGRTTTKRWKPIR